MSDSNKPLVTLHQFSSSHFNEKARWVLDWKNVEHKRISYLPGPHIPAMKELSNQSSTPVLDWDGQIITGSGHIVDFVNAQIADNPLYPDSPEQRVQITAWCRRLDDELGPAVRTIAWSAMIDHAAYAIRVFGRGKSKITLFFYSLIFPFLKSVIGDQFTAADLTAAALIAPIANPDHIDMKRPSPVLPALQEILDHYAEHPAIAWVEQQYRVHRG